MILTRLNRVKTHLPLSACVGRSREAMLHSPEQLDIPSAL